MASFQIGQVVGSRKTGVRVVVVAVDSDAGQIIAPVTTYRIRWADDYCESFVFAHELVAL
jgi:hypothetical protein